MIPASEVQGTAILPDTRRSAHEVLNLTTGRVIFPQSRIPRVGGVISAARACLRCVVVATRAGEADNLQK